MRTEEKKREKERQSATLTPVITTPAENESTPTEAVLEQKQTDQPSVELAETNEPAEAKSVEATNEVPALDVAADTDVLGPAEPVEEV